MTTDQITILIAIASAAGAVFMALIGAIWWMFWKNWTETVKDLRGRLTTAELAHEADRREFTTKHDELGRRFFEELEKVRNKVGDLEVTTAEFGGTFLARREYEADKDREARRR